MSLELEVVVLDSAWRKQLPRAKSRLTKALTHALSEMPAAISKRSISLAVALSDDARVKQLNHQFRGKNKPTNVLSFSPYSDDELKAALRSRKAMPLELGDIVLARETVEREARAQDKSFADHATHLTVHGLLHLLGHDHETDSEAEDMEALEIAILAKLGIDNPYQLPN